MSAYDRWLNEGFDDNYRDCCPECDCDPCECDPDYDEEEPEPDEALMWGGVDGPRDPN